VGQYPTLAHNHVKLLFRKKAFLEQVLAIVTTCVIMIISADACADNGNWSKTNNIVVLLPPDTFLGSKYSKLDLGWNGRQEKTERKVRGGKQRVWKGGEEQRREKGGRWEKGGWRGKGKSSIPVQLTSRPENHQLPEYSYHKAVAVSYYNLTD